MLRARAQRPLAGLLLVVLTATTLAACGGAAKPLSGVTVTVAQAPATGAATTATTATTPARTPKPHAAAPAPARGGANSGAGGSTTAGGAPPHRASAQTQAIAGCLTHAGLVKAGLRSAGLWGGNDPTTGESVLVDGPYKTTGAADTSARSLTGVEFAERGGRYVASATLKSHLGTAVHQVAQCLDGAGAGGSGAGRSLSF